MLVAGSANPQCHPPVVKPQWQTPVSPGASSTQSSRVLSFKANPAFCTNVLQKGLAPDTTAITLLCVR